MAYQGIPDLVEMAKDLVEMAKDKNWMDLLSQINSLQTLYLLYQMESQGLEKIDLAHLAAIGASSMNKNQTGEGYLSEMKPY